jgi:hypothetical protein
LDLVTGIPLVVTLQGETLMDDHDIYSHSAALRGALRRAAAVIGCSSFTLADARERFGVSPGSGNVIFNGVAANQQPAANDGPVDGRLVLALGRVVDTRVSTC